MTRLTHIARTGTLFLFLLQFLSCTNDQPSDPTLEVRLEEVLANRFALYSTLFPDKPAGVFIAVKNADMEAFASYGFDDAMTSNTHFKGASTTKTFTAAAVMLLQDQGKLSIDDTVTGFIPGTLQPYLPETPEYAIPFKNEITIRQLLAHRAGVFDVTNSDMPDSIAAPYAGMRYPDYLKDLYGETFTFSFDVLIAPVALHQLYYFTPDAGMHYSNTGYNLLGKIVERVSGMPLSEFKKQHLLDPFDMTGTHFPDDGTEIILPSPFVDSYLRIGDDILDITEDNLSSAVSEGNIVTTPKDLATWAYHLYATTDVLTSSSLSAMTNPVLTNEHHVLYGLGCQMYPEDIGVGHNGVRASFMTVMRYHAPTQTAYVISTNTLYLDDLFFEDAILVNIIRDAIAVVGE